MSAIRSRQHAGVTELERHPLLDRPTPPNPLLDAIMRDAVTRLYLLANGATASLAEKVRNGNQEKGSAPVADMTCHTLLVRFEHSRTHRDRLMLILTAQKEREAAQRVDPATVRGTDEWRAAVLAAKGSGRKVAAQFGLSEAGVRKMRAQEHAVQVRTNLRQAQVRTTFHDVSTAA